MSENAAGNRLVPWLLHRQMCACLKLIQHFARRRAGTRRAEPQKVYGHTPTFGLSAQCPHARV